MESSTGFNNYMWELGVNWFTRQIANLLYPLDSIRQAEDGLVSYSFTTTFRNGHIEFYIDVPFEEYTLDYRTTTSLVTLEGNILTKDQVPDASSGDVTTRQVREFLDTDNDGVYETMILVLTVKDKPRATSRRVFKRV